MSGDTPGTVASIIAEASATLAGSSPSPRLDAEILLSHVLGKPRSHLHAWPEQFLPQGQLVLFDSLIRRRQRGEPIAYLTGVREFWSLPLKVGAGTLIPRPETELLVERALARIPHEATWRVADLGTGCGAIALALAKERPHCRITATDCTEDSLAVARENADHLGICGVEWRQGDWFEAITAASFELIVANPPYVREADPHRSSEVRWEPRVATIAGPDGLRAIRHIAAGAADHLTAPGWLMLEHGFDHRSPVYSIFSEQGFTDIRCYQDASGLDRMTECRLARLAEEREE